MRRSVEATSLPNTDAVVPDLFGSAPRPPPARTKRPVQKVASDLLPVASVFVTKGTGVVALAAGQLARDRARGPPAIAVMAVVDGTEALLALSHHFSNRVVD